MPRPLHPKLHPVSRIQGHWRSQRHPPPAPSGSSPNTPPLGRIMQQRRHQRRVHRPGQYRIHPNILLHIVNREDPHQSKASGLARAVRREGRCTPERAGRRSRDDYGTTAILGSRQTGSQYRLSCSAAPVKCRGIWAEAKPAPLRVAVSAQEWKEMADFRPGSR